MADEGDKKIKVVIDPDLEDVIPMYLENRHKDINAMEESLAKKDFETIRILGHSMKGSGGGYGFEEITNIGKSLEQAAKEQDADSIQKGITELKYYLKHLEITYG